MHRKFRTPAGVLTLMLAVGLPLFPQGTSSVSPTSSSAPGQYHAPLPQGLQAPWDLKQMLAALNSQNEKMKPVLDSMHPQQWIDNGAPPAYVSQYQDARSRMDDVIASVKALSQQTDSLSAALDTYFRMESLETSLRTVHECVQKYGDRSAADQLAALIAQNFGNRQKFREYLHDLSTQWEQECKVADEEAQRCRGMISRELPSTAGKKHK